LKVGDLVIEDPPGMAVEDTNLWYSVGGKGDKTYIVDNGGATLVPTAGQKIHSRSKYGMLIDRVAKELQVDAIIDAGSPREAHIWMNRRFHFTRELLSYKGLQGADGATFDLETSIVLPDQFISADGSSTTVAPPTAANATGTGKFAPNVMKVVMLSYDKTLRQIQLAVLSDTDLEKDSELTTRVLANNVEETFLTELVAAGMLVKNGDLYQKGPNAP
jgi:hypothetical protein